MKPNHCTTIHKIKKCILSPSLFWATAMLIGFFSTGCQESSKPSSQAPIASNTCTENKTAELCGQISTCEWSYSSCQTKSSTSHNPQTNNTESCSSKIQTNCTSPCVWISTTSSCQDNSTLTSLGQFQGTGTCHLTTDATTCDANTSCFWHVSSCQETAGRCAYDITTCAQQTSISQGCTVRNNRCVPTTVTSGFPGQTWGGQYTTVPGVNTTCENILDFNTCNQYQQYCQIINNRCTSRPSSFSQPNVTRPQSFMSSVLLPTLMMGAINSIANVGNGGNMFQHFGQGAMGGMLLGTALYANQNTGIPQQSPYENSYQYVNSYPNSGYPQQYSGVNCGVYNYTNCPVTSGCRLINNICMQ